MDPAPEPRPPTIVAFSDAVDPIALHCFADVEGDDDPASVYEHLHGVTERMDIGAWDPRTSTRSSCWPPWRC